VSVRDLEIRRLKERLQQLEQERAAIEGELAEVVAAGPTATLDGRPTLPSPLRDQPFDNRAKVELFRNLFRGRPDVFPLRWENLKTGKSG
jgi:hypothetical protein